MGFIGRIDVNVTCSQGQQEHQSPDSFSMGEAKRLGEKQTIHVRQVGLLGLSLFGNLHLAKTPAAFCSQTKK